MHPADDTLWNGEEGAGGISWVDRSRMGPLRGVIDAADSAGRRNAYMHVLHTSVVERELRRAPRKGRALDFGCGTGRMLRTLSKHCREVCAVDREPAMVEATYRYAGHYARRIACWEGEQTPFEDASFDFVLCCSVLCVTASQLFDRSLSEIARLSKPGATLLLLEQIAPAKGLTLRRYYQALSQAGFEPVRAYAVRSSSSAFTRLITKHPWIPPWAYGALASLEVTHVARRRYTVKNNPYVEYAILARKR